MFRLNRTSKSFPLLLEIAEVYNNTIQHISIYIYIKVNKTTFNNVSVFVKSFNVFIIRCIYIF